MKYNLFFLLFAIHVCASAQTNNSAFNSNDLSLQWEVVENNYKGKREFLSAFTLTNGSKQQFSSKGWSIYFNFPRIINAASVTGNVRIEHINGDFYKLSPETDFKPLLPRQSVRINFIAGAWGVSISDAPAGIYIVWDNAPEKGFVLNNYVVKPSTQHKQFQRYAGDKMEVITPQKVYEQNKSITDIAAADLTKVFPTPASYVEANGIFILDHSVSILTTNFPVEKEYLASELKNLLGKEENNSNAVGSKAIELKKNDLQGEAYQLSIAPDKISIAAGTAAGIFYGIQSLKTAMPANAFKRVQTAINIPAMEVIDSPRFIHRAFMLDVARNFHSKQQIFKLLDLMALYKLNVFHFHFSDDEGWRLQIPGLPELTQIGAKRGHTLKDEAFLHPSFGSGPDVASFGSGFYSKQDFMDILKYANERHIKVIPEIETPGHARAAVASMTARYHRLIKEGKKVEAEEYLLYDAADTSKYKSVQGWYKNIMNVALPSTYTFLEKVVDEIVLMYKETGAPLQTIHFGGDEVPGGVWEGSPVVQQLIKTNSSVNNINDLWYYFFGNVNKLLQKKGLYLYGWEEIAMRKTMLDAKPVYIPNPQFVNQNFQVDVWNNVIGWGAEDLPYQLANAGYKVILSPVTNMYFDMAYQKVFEEPGYYWGGYLDVDKPFNFIPFDYFKNSTEDINGNKVTPIFFANKERLTDYGKQNIPGIQGLLWSETIKSPQQMEYMILPKLLALAERAWAKDPDWATEKDSSKAAALYNKAWSQFVNVAGKRELPRLDYYAGGFMYRIPTAGAIINKGIVAVNTQFPGLQIRYTTNGTEPNFNSSLYTLPINTKGLIKIKLFTAGGRGGRTIEINNR